MCRTWYQWLTRVSTRDAVVPSLECVAEDARSRSECRIFYKFIRQVTLSPVSFSIDVQLPYRAVTAAWRRFCRCSWILRRAPIRSGGILTRSTSKVVPFSFIMRNVTVEPTRSSPVISLDTLSTDGRTVCPLTCIFSIAHQPSCACRHAEASKIELFSERASFAILALAQGTMRSWSPR